MQGRRRTFNEDNLDNIMTTQSSNTPNMVGNWREIHWSNSKKMKRNSETEYQSFAPLRIEVGRLWKKEIRERKEKHINEGQNEKKARAMAIGENIKDIRKDLREAYANYITHWMNLSENSQIHQKVMAKVKELHDTEDFDWESAARMAIKEYKPIINTSILPEQENDTDDDSQDEEDNENDSESEKEDEI